MSKLLIVAQEAVRE